MKTIRFPVLLFGFVLMLAANSNAKVWVVNANGTGDFTTLKAAIDSAATGDTIFVAAGGYVESPAATTKKLAILGIGFSSPSVTTWSITLNTALSLGGGSVLSGLELKGSANPLVDCANKSITVEKCHLTVDGQRNGIRVGADSCLVRQNIIQSTSGGGRGNDVAGFLRGVRILNNIVANFADGFYLPINPGDDEIIANNIFLKNSQRGLFLQFQNVFAGKIYGNIFRDNQSAVVLEGGGQFYFAYNDFFGNGFNNIPSYDVGSITTDPTFMNYVNASGYVYGTSDLHLGASSPCINTGEPNVGNNDRDGSRNDMGVYGGPNQLDDTGAPIYPAVITVVVSPYAAPLNGTITIKVLGRIGQ